MVILLSWLTGQFAVLGGMHFELVNAIQHCAAAVFAFNRARGFACMLTASLFVPLTAVDTLRLLDLVDALSAWHWVLGLALLQAVTVPAGNDWARIRATWRAYRSNKAINRALDRMLPC